MDARSFRLGNGLVGNPEGSAGLEVTLTGPRLRFTEPATVAVTGAPLPVALDGAPAAQWQTLHVPAGGVLALGTVRGFGVRAYVLVGGGIETPCELGARASFPAAGLGHPPLRRGDLLDLGEAPRAPRAPAAAAVEAAARGFDAPRVLRVVLGPHGAPEFLTRAGLCELFQSRWTVHHHSDRTGVRLVGPRPDWARADGGDAGLHPSNILDSAYGVGTVMLAGDVAVIVGLDGPSLGGFVAVAQVIRADLWRLGQLRAGDEIALDVVDHETAARLTIESGTEIAGTAATGPVAPPARGRRTVALDRPVDGVHGTLTYRLAGEGAVIVEFGEPELDLRSRVRAHAMLEAASRERIDGLREITPGVRSLHVQFDPDRVAASMLIDGLERLEAGSPDPERLVINARTVHLPLAWRHSEAMRAIERYQASVRADAPWCPDNIEFICRINGLQDEASLQTIVYDAAYLVLGLGDVYLGAPVAVPLDPRHRLVTTKYTPARTWTPANAVGIGGAFLCIYGIEGPGGYQLVGRTVQIWNIDERPPWRLRAFDRLRFEPVAEAELEALRADAARRGWQPRTEPAAFVLAEHRRELAANAAEIAAFTARRAEAFARERSAWMASDEAAEAA
jgi:urea carboxylase